MPLSSNILLIIASLLSSIIICYLSVLSIVKIAHKYNLVDKPNGRSSHHYDMPLLGGIAIFMGFSISFLLFSNGYFNGVIQYLFVPLLIIFVIGVKDDLMGMSPKKKIIGQIIAALIVVILGDFRITNVHGFLGFHEINYISSIIVSVFSIMVISNAFNIIDGIDGLASGVSALVSLAFGICFYLSGNYPYTILCSCFFGSVLIFSWFNVFGKENKIFMGDTGSMILGFIVAIMVIAFNETSISSSGAYTINSASVVASGILIVPFFDMIRVISLRILRGKAPWYPDKNHVHHRLLNLGYSHFKSTLLILIANMLVITLTFYLQYINIEIHLFLFILLSMGAILTLIPFILYNLRKRRL